MTAAKPPKSNVFGDFRTLTTPEAVLRHALEYFETTPRPSQQGDACRYRGPEGSCCVFGSAFPDGLYGEGWEDLDAASVLGELGLTPALGYSLVSLWADLQGIHDAVSTCWDLKGGLNLEGSRTLKVLWARHVPNTPFPGYCYRGPR